MNRPTDSRATLLVALGLAACGPTPTDPVAEPVRETAVSASTARAPTDFRLTARSGREPIDLVLNGQTTQGTFDARLVSRNGVDRGTITAFETATAGGRGWAFETEIVSLSLRSSAPILVEFSGRARLFDPATGWGPWIAVDGTAASSGAVPDCVIFDIVGSGVHLTAELPARLKA